MTYASDTRPTRRTVSSFKYGDEYILEVHRTLIRLRPKRTRSGGPSEVTFSVGLLYQRGIAEKIEAERRAKARARRERTRTRKDAA